MRKHRANEMSADQAAPMSPSNPYWSRVRRLTAQLFALWLLSTCLVVFFARELSGVTLFGWPLSFYLAAQGVLLLYLAIVVAYARRMRRLEREYGTSPDQECDDGR